MRGRPKEFDRQEVLQRAVELFWKKGYQATSIDDLVNCMGIGRQSLYDTFGDKEALFCEVIDHYSSTAGQVLIGALQAPESPRENIRSVFQAIVEMSTNGKHRGCLVVNTTIEFADSDQDSPVLKVLKATFEKLERAMRKTLQRAVEQGELAPEFNVPQWATFLIANMQGMLVMTKTGTTRRALQRVADSALTILFP